MYRVIIFILFSLSLLGCQSTTTKSSAPQWDFDHKVQYREKQLTDTSYHIEVISHNDTRFEVLATFLMRRSLEICQSYGFKIEVLKGVEEFNDKLGLPNMIIPSLAANVYCAAAK